MNIPNLTAIVVSLVLFTASVVEGQIGGLLFTVNHNADSNDANIGDRVCADSEGRCTLRTAIQEANAGTSGPDIIIFGMPWPAVIDLTLGPLVITEPGTSIVGPGARRLTVQRSSSPETMPFRIFHVPSDGTMVIRGLTIRNGIAGALLRGGGIRIGPGGSVELSEIAFVNNSGGTGGAISSEGTLTVTRSLIGSNIAGFQGGAIHCAAGCTARIMNSTITENTAPTGGAIWNAGTMLLVNNTITHNAATEAARSIFSDSSGSINVLNTIVGSDNTSTPNSLSGSFVSLGSNIVTDARTSAGFTNGVNNDKVSDGNIINPLLGNLADNGGQTDTRTLLNGSPAINAGNNCVFTVSCTLPPGPMVRLFFDQRVPYFRQAGGTVDIGSFESGSNAVGGGGSFTGTFQDRPGKYLGSIVILTNTETNEKKYAVMNLAGTFRFQNFLPGVVYIEEIKTKRGTMFGPRILPRFD